MEKDKKRFEVGYDTDNYKEKTFICNKEIQYKNNGRY